MSDQNQIKLSGRLAAPADRQSREDTKFSMILLTVKHTQPFIGERVDVIPVFFNDPRINDQLESVPPGARLVVRGALIRQMTEGKDGGVSTRLVVVGQTLVVVAHESKEGDKDGSASEAQAVPTDP